MLTAPATPAWPRKESVYCHNFNLFRQNDWCHSPSPSPSRGSSPYPPSTPSLSSCSSSDDDGSDSESQSTPTAACTTITNPTKLMKTHLRTTLASLPESQLRELIAKLVDRSPGFQHALVRELFHSQFQTRNLPPDTPRPAKTRLASQKQPQQPRQRRRPLRRATITGGTATDTGHPTATAHLRSRSSSYSPRHQVFYYHPGRLEEDVFEFPSWSSRGSGDEEEEPEKDLPVLRTIRMWSCCDGDVGSAGCCCSAPSVQIGQGHKVSRTGAT